MIREKIIVVVSLLGAREERNVLQGKFSHGKKQKETLPDGVR
jgi:hypothetical protein